MTTTITIEERDNWRKIPDAKIHALLDALTSEENHRGEAESKAEALSEHLSNTITRAERAEGKVNVLVNYLANNAYFCPPGVTDETCPKNKSVDCTNCWNTYAERQVNNKEAK